MTKKERRRQNRRKRPPRTQGTRPREKLSEEEAWVNGKGQERSPSRWPIVLASLALVGLVSAAFFPILGFEFTDLDVPGQVIDNPHIRAITWHNLKHIFTSRSISSYYPIRTLTYAIDYQIWGLHPGGFKLTNTLFHLVNVFLVLWLILRLFRHPHRADGSPWARWDVAVAALSAGIFAVHPVVVEPVTWVPGREELLMTLGALGCFHAHLAARRFQSDGARWPRVLAWHLCAAVFCAIACMSNAVGAVIPLLIIAWDVIMLPRPKLWKILGGTSVLWLISIATVVIKKLGESRDTSALEGVFTGEWVAIVIRTYWLNLSTLVWPTKLAVAYEWIPPKSFAQADVILGGIALAVTCAALWTLRRRKLLVFGLVWFGLALAPYLQIIPHHVYRSDRFLYLPLVGLCVAVAMVLRPLGNTLKTRRAITAVTAAGLLVLLVLEGLSVRQVRRWRNSISVWKHCVSVAPRSPFARQGLASNLASAGRFDLAIPHYEIALRLDPMDAFNLSDYAGRLATWPDERWRDHDRAIRLASRACELTQWNDPKPRRTLALAYMNGATNLKRRRQFERAIEDYRKAMEADPQYDVPLFNLARLLATCPLEQFRQPDEAVRLAERACEMVEHPGPIRLIVLAEVYAETGRLAKAIATLKKALRGAEADRQTEWYDELRRRLELYQKGDPRAAREGQP